MEAGSPAIATSSWSFAAARGLGDGENVGFEELLTVAHALVRKFALLVTVDMEAGYAHDVVDVAANAAELARVGVAGVNVEDANPETGRVLSIADQVARLAAVKEGAATAQKAIFLNARTDVFLREPDCLQHRWLVDDAIDRCFAYAEAGADGFFIPGTVDLSIIGKICDASPVPVNIMSNLLEVTCRELSDIGVKRVSAGPSPWFAFEGWFRGEAAQFYR